MRNRIREARRRYAERVGKFTQGDAADYFGVSKSTYQKWEQGNGMMNGEQLIAISRLYGVTVDWLLMVEHRRSEPIVDESALVALYRSMDRNGRAALMENAEFLAARHPLNKAVSA